MNPPNTHYFEAVSVERELPDTNCPVAIIQDGSSPFDSYFDGKNFIDEGVICNPSHWLRPVTITDEVSDEEIDAMFPMTFYDGTLTLDDKLFYIKRITAKKVRDKLAPTIAALKKENERLNDFMNFNAQQAKDLAQQLAEEKSKSRENAIGFAEWIQSNLFVKNGIYWYKQDAIVEKAKTSSDLYSLYLTSLDKQSEGK